MYATKIEDTTVLGESQPTSLVYIHVSYLMNRVHIINPTLQQDYNMITVHARAK